MPRVARGDCSKNRIHLHHQVNKGPAPKTIRFFKVMFGANLDKLMHLPPKISPIMVQFCGKVFVLKDTEGCRWPVLLSTVNGELAFTNGWAPFFRHHKLEESSFLTFEYEEESNFLFVRVYEKSGCEENFQSKAADDRSTSPREPEAMEDDADTFGSVDEIIEDDTPPDRHDKKRKATKRVSNIEKASGSKGRDFKMKSREINVGPSSVGVKKSLKYQELPVPIPTISGRDLGQVIYLKDLKGWVWPFLNQDKRSMKLLADKWEKFCCGNNIMEHDECMFEVEDANLGIYRVYVVARCST